MTRMALGDFDSPRRLLGATSLLVIGVVLGSTIYYRLGEGRWDFWDCVYMTVITLSTVGFAETLPGIALVPYARLFTVILIVIGSGVLLYVASNLTAIFVEGDLRGLLRRRRMQREIDAMKGHIIVCGVGSHGEHVVEELASMVINFVVVEQDEGRLLRVREQALAPFHYVIGDATDDKSLEHAGVAKAHGLVAALHEDKENLFCTITARALNPSLRIVARAVETSAVPKLKRAGADQVVSTNRIGGQRMASELIRPQVVAFLDGMIRDKDQNLRIEELTIPSDSGLVDKMLSETPIRDSGALVIAMRTPGGGYQYNPGADARIESNATLIIIAKAPDVERLRSGIAAGTL